MLAQLEEARPVTLHWVKAYAGHELNEEADRAAKFGTFSRCTYTVPLAEATIKAELRGALRKEWTSCWRAEPTCRQTRLILPKPAPQPASFLFKLTRHNLSMMVQFISGHNHLKYHQTLTGKSQISQCRLCEEDTETAWHLLNTCPALELSLIHI